MKKSVELFDYKYFIKIDHDTLVDLPNLAKRIRTLRDDNVFTGACTFRIANGEYKNLFSYCGGGGYILSRDLAEKISSLVAEVKRKFNVSKIRPVKLRNIVNKRRKTGRYRFYRWFYHWLKSVHAFLRAE